MTNLINKRRLLSQYSSRQESESKEAPIENTTTIPPEVQAAMQQSGNTVANRYTKIAELGQGGMGEVWKAWDHELNRFVALKIIGSHLRMARKEAHALASMKSKNICKVFDVGEIDGKLFITMELIEGKRFDRYYKERLDRCLQRERELLPAELGSALKEELNAVLKIFAVVCDTVHEMHKLKVIHRDIKPSNILIQETDREVHPVLIDFGLATTEQAPAGPEGTIGFMAPEVALKGRHSVRSDIFSLGATLFYVLTGKHHLQGIEGSSKELKSAEFFEACKSRASIDLHKAWLYRSIWSPPDELESVLKKCLQFKARDRYASAAEIADDLRNFIDNKPVRAHSGSPMYRFWKYLKRNWGKYAVAGLVIWVFYLLTRVEELKEYIQQLTTKK